jgi:ribosomal protein S18 acetylase RimI-like enzyme
VFLKDLRNTSNGVSASLQVNSLKWPPVCDDLLEVESGSRCLVRAAKPGDWDHPDLLRDYFSSAAPGVGVDVELTPVQALLKRAFQPTFLVALFAEAADIGCAGLLLEDKAWDTSMLSVQVRSLTVLVSAPNQQARYATARQLIDNCLSHHRESLGDCIFVRIPSDDPALLRALAESGFGTLVPMVTLGKNLSRDSKVPLPAGVELTEAERCEIDQVRRLSAVAFRWGRFAADMRLPRLGVERLHGTWAQNCCLGAQADHVLVARDNREVLGFIALKFQMAHEVRVGSIELIAIAESSRGKGLGRALVAEGCKWLSRFTNYVVVRTELPNTAALRMYETQGFRVLNGSLYLSRHNQSHE